MAGNLCNASPAADSVPALIAAGAKAVIVGPKGKRNVPVETGPGRPGQDLAGKGELVESILLPQAPAAFGRCLSALHPAHRNGYRRGRRRRQPDARRQGHLHGARVSRSAPWRRRVLLVPAARQGADRHQARRRGAREARRRRSAACRPIDDKRGTIEFRIKVAGVLARRAAEIALKRARRQVMIEHSRFDHDQRRRRRVPLRGRRDAARRAARPPGPDRHQGRLRHRRLRRLQRHARWPPRLLLPRARRRGRGRARSRPSRAWPRATSCIPCSRSSSSMPPCNAASARRAS